VQKYAIIEAQYYLQSGEDEKAQILREQERMFFKSIIFLQTWRVCSIFNCNKLNVMKYVKVQNIKKIVCSLKNSTYLMGD
jgi:hypothetical protein